VKLGADYGWPFAEPDPDSPSGLDDMLLDPSYETNRDWSKYPESKFTRSDKGIQAHSAPLGMSFLQDRIGSATQLRSRTTVRGTEAKRPVTK
jgi:hypothetical protein